MVKRLVDVRSASSKLKIVARGFTQWPGFEFDETDIVVGCFDSLLGLVAIMVVQSLRPWQVDIKSAFLDGDLNEQIYLTLAES
jgi:hypothetical protein